MPSRGQSGIATVLDWNTSSNVYKTGDAGNVTLWFIKDGVLTTPTNQTAIAEISGSGGGPIGAYTIAFTSTEATCNTLWIGGQSSTANCAIIPILLTFEQLPLAAPGSSNGLITIGSGSGQLSMASGFGYANLQQWFGLPPNVLQSGLVQAAILSGASNANVTQWLGTAVTAATAGVPDVNTKNVNNFAVQANSGFVQANVIQILGAVSVGVPGYVGRDWSAVANASAVQVFSQTTISGVINAPTVTLTGITSTAQFGVNVVTIAGALASSSLASGGVNVNKWLGSSPNALSSGNVQADVETWRTVAPNTLISGRVDSSVGQVQTGGIGAGAYVPGALVTTAFASQFRTLALTDSTYQNGLADALGNRSNAIETGLTPYQSWQLVAASQGGQLSGAGTTQIGIWGAGVSTTRISAVTDQSGNRSSVTLNL